MLILVNVEEVFWDRHESSYESEFWKARALWRVNEVRLLSTVSGHRNSTACDKKHENIMGQYI